MAGDDSHGMRRVRAAFGMGYTLMLFGGTFVIYALMFAVLDGPFDTVTATASNLSQTNASATGIGWVQQAWAWSPFWAAILGMVMVLAGAVVQSGGRF